MSLCNVNIGTGSVYHYAVDFSLRGFIPVQFIRDYDSTRKSDSALGYNWAHNQDRALRLEGRTALYIAPDGSTAVPHPDYPADESEPTLFRTWRESGAVLLSDRQNNLLRFEPFERGVKTLHLTSRTDPRGNRIVYSRDASGLLLSITDPYGRILLLTPDNRGRVAKLSAYHPDVPGSDRDIYDYLYDIDGNLRSVRNGAGGIDEFNYSGHLLTEHVNPLGGRTYFEYDSKERCTHTYREDGSFRRVISWEDDKHAVKVTDSRGASWTYILNGQNRPLLEVDPMGRTKEYVYDSEGNLLFVNQDGAPQAITMYFEDTGTLIRQNGPMTNMVRYDDRMRIVERINPAGAKWMFDYDDQSNRIATIDPRQFTWRFDYDPDGWLNSALNPRGYRVTRKRSDRRLRVEYRDEIGLLGALRYTPFGLIEALEDSSGHATHFEYNVTGGLTAIKYSDRSQMSYEYDAMGDMTRIQTEGGATTSFRYDKFGAAVAMSNADGHQASFRYDSEGNMIEVRNFKGEVASFGYDIGGKLTSARLFDGRYHAYVLDLQDRVSRVTGGDQQSLLEIERDELGRITKKIYRDGWEVTYKWGDHSELLEAANPHATITFEWTPDMRIAAEHVNDFSIFYNYDEVGNRKQLVTNLGRAIEYSWDARNRLVKIVDSGHIEYSFEYDSLDLFAKWNCPGVAQTFQFDTRHRMRRRTAVKLDSGTMIGDRAFEYDIEGKLVKMRDPQHGNFTYRYSILGAILSVESEAGGHTEQYAYDPNENLIQGYDGSQIGYGLGNRLAWATGRRFNHNSAGSMTGLRENEKEWSLQYDPEERLSKVEGPDGLVAEYQYDPLGRRIAKTVNGRTTKFLWDGGSLLREVDCSGEGYDYLFLPETLLPLGVTQPAGHFSFVLDQAGTPTEAVDSQGEVAWSGDYTAFGELLSEHQNRIRNTFRFQGQYYDEETGFHYNFQRYYYPRYARYLTQDPLGVRSGANVYRYVLNPFNWVDPRGLDFADGVLTIFPICGWSEAQQKDANKKMDAMNEKIGDGVKIPKEPVKRCGASAKEIYEDCQEQAKAEGKPPAPDLKEASHKCFNEQADHILEICAGGGEKDCSNLQPLNESVNKSYGSQVASAVRQNPGAMLTEVKLAGMEDCTDRPSVDC
jgi:RHS repeat-associated protein